MKVKVYRFDKEKDDKSYFVTYDLPISCDDEYTIMDILDYISLKIDPTLSYYKHSACNRGICGRCLVRVNGKSKLACTTKVNTEEILLEPISIKNLVKDLVVNY